MYVNLNGRPHPRSREGALRLFIPAELVKNTEAENTPTLDTDSDND